MFCTTVVAATMSLLLSGPTKTESARCHGSIFVVFRSFLSVSFGVLELHLEFADPCVCLFLPCMCA